MSEQVQEYLVHHQLDGVIRIPDEEYVGFPDTGYLTHFNLEHTTIEKGRRYALPRILKYGERGPDKKTTVFPELSFENIKTAECLEVRNHVSYDSLTPEDFKNSFRHISNVGELKKFILKRYQKSRPHLSPEEMLSCGVSKVVLKLGA